MRAALGLLLASLAPASPTGGGTWIRPASADAPLIWGRSDGVVFGLPSAGGMRGPRGLIRVGVPAKTSQQPELINFVAIEPVAPGHGTRQSRMAFSELEPSQLDPGLRGKRLWVADGSFGGELTTFVRSAQNVEQLSVRIEVEAHSANKTHVYVVARMQSDRPEEIAFSVHHHPDSAPIDELTLTATMGNFERLRYLWLKDRRVDSRDLYSGYLGNGFVEQENYPIEEMLRSGDGDAVALATTNEPDPAAVEVRHGGWSYGSARLTQYWRVPARHIQPDLRVRVNGRRVYWASEFVIPGGIAFENFEVRQRYVPGQEFVFGLTPRSPWEIQPKIPRLAALKQ